LSALRIAPRRFPVRPARRHSRERLGTTVSWSDDVAATTALRITRSAAGLLRGRSCVAPPRHRPRHARRCTRTVAAGSLAHLDRAGANRIAFGGRVGGHLLAGGRYRMTLVARLGRLTSRPVSGAFTITR